MLTDGKVNSKRSDQRQSHSHSGDCKSLVQRMQCNRAAPDSEAGEEIQQTFVAVICGGAVSSPLPGNQSRDGYRAYDKSILATLVAITFPFHPQVGVCCIQHHVPFEPSRDAFCISAWTHPVPTKVPKLVPPCSHEIQGYGRAGHLRAWKCTVDRVH